MVENRGSGGATVPFEVWPSGRAGFWSRYFLVALILACATQSRSQVDGGLPPDIEVDRHHREATLRLSDGDYSGAARSLAKVHRLVEEHEGVGLPESYWFHHARACNGLDDLACAHRSVTAYLNAEGRDGDHYDEALRLLIRLDASLPGWERDRDLRTVAATTVRRQLTLAERPALKEELRSGGRGPEMVLVGAGYVPVRTMRAGHHFSRKEVRAVASMYVAKYETTVREFSRFVDSAGYETEARRLRNNGCSNLPDTVGVLGYDRAKARSGRDWQEPGFAQTDRDPVVCVSIADARSYVRWLSEQTGSTYRLPTESEWLLAARAGTYAGSELADSRELLESEIAPVALDSQYVGGCLGSENRDGYPLEVVGAHCGSGGGDYWDPAGEATLPVGRSKGNAIGVFGLWGNAYELTERCRDVEVWGAGMQSAMVVEKCGIAGASFRTGDAYQGLSVRPYVYRYDQFQRRNQRFHIPNNSADTGFRIVREVD